MKKSFKSYVQIIIMVSMMLNGFIKTYEQVWTLIGLPMVWWANAILFVLAGLSVLGLIRWIIKG